MSPAGPLFGTVLVAVAGERIIGTATVELDRMIEGTQGLRPSHANLHFVILAPDTRLDLAAGSTRSALESRLPGHVLGKGELVATYQRA